MRKYRIGQFAKAMGVTTEFLRYYEEQGLISSIQDESNKYHYYDFSQSLTVSRILYLRSMGFPVKDIKEILTNSDKSQAIRLYHQHERRLNEEISAFQYAQKMLIEFEDTLSRSKSENWFIIHREPFYFLPHTKDEEYYLDKETAERMKDWRSRYPYVFDLDYWPVKFKDTEALFPCVYHGLAAEANIAEKLGLNVTSPVRMFPGGRYLEYHIASPLTTVFSPSRKLTQAKYNDIFELCREKGLKISGDMFVRFISIYQEQDLYIDHSIVYCPVI